MVIALPFKIRIHTKIFLNLLLFDIHIPPLTANGHGFIYRKLINLSEQLHSYALGNSKKMFMRSIGVMKLS